MRIFLCENRDTFELSLRREGYSVFMMKWWKGKQHEGERESERDICEKEKGEKRTVKIARER